MSFIQTPDPVATRVRVDDDGSNLHIDLADGRALSVPLAFFPWLMALEPEARNQFGIIGEGTGIWWSVPDEGISVPALFGLPCE